MYSDEQTAAIWIDGVGKKPFLLVQYDTATKQEKQPQTFYAKNKKEARALAVEWTIRYCSPVLRVHLVTEV